jgi:hypothetical protein
VRLEGRTDFCKYEDLEPFYTEYNVHFARVFSLSNRLDQNEITARRPRIAIG